MKKLYECPEAEVVKYRLTEVILTSIEDNMNSEIKDFEDPTGIVDDL